MSRGAALIGGGIIASGLVLNPWVAKAVWPHSRVIDRLDVLGGYLFWSMALGSVTLLSALAVRRGRVSDGVALALVLTAVLVLADRLLLVWLGLPLWIHDPVLHYRNRPNATRTLAYAQRPTEVIRINRFGYHDDEFPVTKPPGEVRAVVLGDSVTMAFGLRYDETFTGRLEHLLHARDHARRRYQLINTAVMGYSTDQEARTLEEALRFDPDLVLVGFCLNDFSDPLVQNLQHGGTGLDGNRVAQVQSRTLGWLVNETGYGRLMLALREGRNRERLDALSRQLDLSTFLARTDDRQLDAAWALVLSRLERIYRVAYERRIPVVLLLFPMEFQLLATAQTPTYRRLAEHARRFGAHPIDLGPVLGRAVFDDPGLLALLRARPYSEREILEFYRPRLRRYFLDEVHLSERAHRLVAATIADHLITHIGLAGGAGASSSEKGVDERPGAASAEGDQHAQQQQEEQDGHQPPLPRGPQERVQTAQRPR